MTHKKALECIMRIQSAKSKKYPDEQMNIIRDRIEKWPEARIEYAAEHLIAAWSYARLPTYADWLVSAHDFKPGAGDLKPTDQCPTCDPETPGWISSEYWWEGRMALYGNRKKYTGLKECPDCYPHGAIQG